MYSFTSVLNIFVEYSKHKSCKLCLSSETFPAASFTQAQNIDFVSLSLTYNFCHLCHFSTKMLVRFLINIATNSFDNDFNEV